MDATLVISQSEAKKAEQKESLKNLQRSQQKALLSDKPVKETESNRAKGVKIKEHEKHLVHVELISRNWNESTRKADESKKTVKIQPRNFEQMIKDNAFAEYDEARVIHDPRPNAPKEVALKPAADRPPVFADDAAIAAREQQLKDRERRIAEAEARLDEKLAKLEGPGKETLPPPPQV